MKLPGPDHPITVETNPNRVRLVFNGKVVANTSRALSLNEADYPAVQYIPREDADMSAFEPTPHHTHCPYKGDASYFTLKAAGKVAENAVWSYEKPFPAVAEIAGHLAFYPNRVDRIDQG